MADFLLFLDSFDHYSSADATAKWTAVSVSGGQGFQIEAVGRTGQGASFGAEGAPFLTLPEEYDTLNCGHARKLAGFGNEIIKFTNLRYTSGLSANLEHVGDGRLQVRFCNSGPTDLITGVVLDQNRYYHIAMSAQVVGSANDPDLSCTFTVWINCKVVYTGSLNATLAGAPDVMPKWASLTLLAPGGGVRDFVDDVWLTNGIYLGDGRIKIIKPDGIGDSNDWTAVGDATTWECKDDTVPDYDTTYIETAVITDKELETLEDVSVNGPIKGIQTLWFADKSEAGEASFSGLIKFSGSEETLDTFFPSYGDWLYFRNPQLRNILTNVDWTQAIINGMQQGEERVS